MYSHRKEKVGDEDILQNKNWQLATDQAFTANHFRLPMLSATLSSRDAVRPKRTGTTVQKYNFSVYPQEHRKKLTPIPNKTYTEFCLPSCSFAADKGQQAYLVFGKALPIPRCFVDQIAIGLFCVMNEANRKTIAAGVATTRTETRIIEKQIVCMVAIAT